MKKLYYYRPCQFDNGKTFKCAGHGAESPQHRAFYEPYFSNPRPAVNGHMWGDHFLPGCVVLEGYRGDRIQRSEDGSWVCVSPLNPPHDH